MRVRVLPGGLAAWVLLLGIAGAASAATYSETFDLTMSTDPMMEPNGLSVCAIFTLDEENPTELRIELINTSTGVPAGFNNAHQLLTGISFDFGEAGYNGDPVITGGIVVIGPDGRSINFELVDPQLGPGADVSGEWGYGNYDGSGLLTNFVSCNRAQATRLPGDNLDGPESIDGPQAGLCTDPPIVALGGLGAVADSVVIVLTLDAPLADLEFLYENGVRAEFGSDAAFMVPEPVTVGLLAVGGCLLLLRRRR